MTQAVLTRDVLIAALREVGGDATSGELRQKTGLGKTTVNDYLKAMASEGIVERHGIPARYRLVENVGTVDLPETEIWDYKNPGGDEAPLSNADSDETMVPATSGVADVPSLQADSPSLSDEDEVAEEKAVTRGVCTYPVDREVAGVKQKVPCGAPIHKDGRSWVPDVGTVDEHGHKPTTKTFKAPGAPREPRETTVHVNPHEGGFARGELKALVLKFLRDHPDESFKVAAIAKEVNAFQGSTAFILKKLVLSGEVLLAVEKPAEYKAA